jgi:hypothetical protein
VRRFTAATASISFLSAWCRASDVRSPPIPAAPAAVPKALLSSATFGHTARPPEGFLIAHVPKEGSPHLPAEGASVTTDTQSNRKVISLIYDPEEETQEAFEARKAAVLGLAPDVRACVRG